MLLFAMNTFLGVNVINLDSFTVKMEAKLEWSTFSF